MMIACEDVTLEEFFIFRNEVIINFGKLTVQIPQQIGFPQFLP